MLACGVPPAATRVGGVSELITHGVDGYMEEIGDIAAQAGRVLALFTDVDLYASVAEAARMTGADAILHRRDHPAV